ncbi:MAG: GntR family transcriptional regulator [Acidobacteria bacterium]|nr:GntR family transcriptional regulator [Acidobacteriota bacterium]
MAATETVIINATRISDQVYEYLRNEIVEGHLSPGQRISPDEFAERLKISKMPIKEAIERLVGEGLLDVQSRRGTFVARLDPIELAETFEVRCALEVLAGKLAARHITKADLERLRELIAAMEQSNAKTDVRLHLEQNAEFHALIVRRSGNRKLFETWRRLRAPIHVAGIHSRTDDWIDRVTREQREHRAIVRALEQRDPTAVEQAITNHIMRASGSLVEDVKKTLTES